jgi:8-oxo-dGTP pyrophosphatase MutT (NUDIX family)
VLSALRATLLDAAETEEVHLPGQTPSAVLVPVFLPEGAGGLKDLHVVLTRRRSDLRRHAGEISFPGGRADAEDDSLLATALRETAEEIGLDPERASVLGALQPTTTFVTGYAIHPFVAAIPAGVAWTLSPREVEAVLELPLQALREGYARVELERRGIRFGTDTYTVGEDMVWGATARMLGDLLERWEAARADPAGA